MRGYMRAHGEREQLFLPSGESCTALSDNAVISRVQSFYNLFAPTMRAAALMRPMEFVRFRADVVFDIAGKEKNILQHTPICLRRSAGATAEC